MESNNYRAKVEFCLRVQTQVVVRLRPDRVDLREHLGLLEMPVALRAA